jgi:hypothetical protein
VQADAVARNRRFQYAAVAESVATAVEITHDTLYESSLPLFGNLIWQQLAASTRKNFFKKMDVKPFMCRQD